MVVAVSVWVVAGVGLLLCGKKEEKSGSPSLWVVLRLLGWILGCWEENGEAESEAR